MAPRSSHVEVEWQLVVRDVGAIARALRRSPPLPPWSLAPAPTVHIHDVYFDTADWRIWRTGYALRIRRTRLRVEATLKAVRRAQDGMARRREISVPLPDARLATLQTVRGAIGVRLRRADAASALRRLFTVRTRRRRFVLLHDGRAVAELALDRTHIDSARGRSRRLDRLEVEVTAGSPAVVARFVATVRRARHLKLARRSKFEEGLVAAGLVPPRRR